MKKIVYFVSPVPFPVGGAATSRKHALAKGLVKLGFDVHVISTINDGSGVRETQYLDGIRYHCSAQKKAWGGNKVQKLYHVVCGLFRACSFLIKDHSNYGHCMITTNQYDLLRIFPIWLTAKLIRAFFFTELNENPMLSRKKYGRFAGYVKHVNISACLKLYDHVFVMTYGLKRLLEDRYSYSRPITVLHNAVDLDRFENIDVSVVRHSVGYAGSLSFRKEGLEQILRASRHVKDAIQDFRLRIAYFSNDPHYEGFSEKVRELNLHDVIELHPDVPNQMIPTFLAECEILILVRESNEQTDYGFPTKLVEYLASGRPVIVTPVSDIPLYLTHLKDAYIVDSIDADSVAQAICYLFSQRNAEEVIGMNGKLACQIHFNPEIEAKKIMDAHNMFLSSN